MSETFYNKCFTLIRNYVRDNYPPMLPASKGSKYRGKALFSYLSEPVFWDEHSESFDGHTNKWESWKIAHLLSDYGYDVHCINFNNSIYRPSIKFQAVFDIYTNLSRMFGKNDNSVLKLLHLTGSYCEYQNDAEETRVRNFINQNKTPYFSRRTVSDCQGVIKSLDIADRISLLGNQHTLKTYPSKYWPKTSLVTVSSSRLSKIKKITSEYVPKQKEFVWYGGAGAVHKGLDVVLDVFKKRPNLRLNVFGNVKAEEDFMSAYGRELLELPNIKYYGRMNPSGQEFNDIMARSFCFISPSCSEGISTSSTTLMQLGLLPVISRDNGISLPKGAGLYLEKCSAGEIDQIIQKVYALPTLSIKKMIIKSQSFAQSQFSRENFTIKMQEYLNKILL